MIQIKQHLYDQTGACPVCGGALTPICYYSAVKLGTDVTRRIIDRTTQVKTTTTHYGAISPRYAGWCRDCARRDWEMKEEAKARRKPNPAMLTIASLLLAVGLAGLAHMMITGQNTGLIAGIGMISLLVGVVLFPCMLTSFIKKRRIYRKYAAGWREPFQTDTDRLSASVAYTLSKRATGNQAYLSAGQVERMQRESRQGAAF